MISIRLRPMSAEAARELRAGRAPADLRVADGYPTELSASVAVPGLTHANRFAKLDISSRTQRADALARPRPRATLPG